jgi:predicted RNase H-like HicB family nuclease
MKPKDFFVVIERDEDGMYVGEVPQLKACYSQGETIDELMANIREVIEMCLEELDQEEPATEFIGIQRLVV